MRSRSQKVYIDHKILQGIDIVDPSIVFKEKFSQQDNDQMEKKKEEKLGETLRYFWINGKAMKKPYWKPF